MKTFFALTLLLIGLCAVKARRCRTGNDCPATQCCYIRDPNIASRRDLDARAVPQSGVCKDLTLKNGICGAFLTNFCGCAPGLQCTLFTPESKQGISSFRRALTRGVSKCVPPMN